MLFLTLSERVERFLAVGGREKSQQICSERAFECVVASQVRPNLKYYYKMYSHDEGNAIQRVTK